ncbi:MAG: DUF3572 domain-containing protein [Pseudomonadota bacterium]
MEENLKDQRKSDQAAALALDALAWFASTDDLLTVFLGASGADIEDVKRGAEDPAFLASVLDFLLMDDAWVIGFCDSQGVDYTRPLWARQHLLGGELPNWT